MDHDQNFKNLILDYPRPALNFFAQPEAEVIPEEARILPVRQEQLQDRLGDRFRELDTPLLVEWQSGREAVVFILEEESDTARFSIHRVARYCLDLAELLTMRQVVPVVIFLRPGNYSQELVLATAQMTYLSFRYLVCDLGRLSVEDYLESSNVVASVLLPLMKYAPERRVEVCQQALEGLVELEPNQDKRSKYTEFVTQYAKLDRAEKAELQHRLAQSKYREATMGLIQEAREEGRQEGIQLGLQQGIQQGRQEALQEGLLKAIQFGLELKFGMAGLALLPDIQKIQDLDLLNTIQEALRIANSPQEIRLLWEPPTSH
ncbi:MAG: hypothetical protein U1F76_01360 [Candidatus Competibacteraceae bacterium]